MNCSCATAGYSSGPGLRSADETFLDRYSLAIHVIDSRSGERVAQGDTGVGPGTFVRYAQQIDISRTAAWRLRSARRALRLANWRAPPARDLVTDEVSDMHTLHRFQHN